MNLDCNNSAAVVPDEPGTQRREDVFARIAARAATLDERLASERFVYLDSDVDVVDQRVERLCEQIAKGDRSLFEEVLGLLGYDLQALRRAMSSVQLASTELPGWMELLREGLQEAETTYSGAIKSNIRYRFLDNSEPMPFEQLMAPFVSTAAKKLRIRSGSAYDLLGGESHAANERVLLHWLTNICGPALILTFSLTRLRRQPTFRTRLERLQGNASASLHDEFVEAMLKGGLLTFFDEYSALAKALATVSGNWIDSTAEFLERLDADKNLLATTFLGGKDPGPVMDVKAGLSDPHNGGRTVLALTFSSGLKLVYKPKSVETEDAYGKLLDWITRSGSTLPLCGCTALNRGRYGWIAYIDHFPCQSEAELERFYKRSGMLLSLFHVLNTTDVHSDNLIAAGEHPMLVDAETLITPPLLMAEQREQNEWAEMLAVRKLEDSVTKSAMLPSWKADRAGNALDMSGLGATGGEEVEVSVWQGAQTDQVTQDIAKGRKERNRNVPFPEGMLAQPSRFVDQIEAGFKEIYQLLMENRDVLLEPDSPFENLARAPMRLVFRDTKVYFSLLKQSLEPGVMREGVDRSIHLAILNRILCISNPKSRHLHVVKAEQDALEQLDIPSFTFSPRDRNLRSGKARVDPKYFATPGYERVREKLMRLSLKECEEQCELIRGSFYAKMLNEPTKNDEELSRPYTVGPRRTGEESDFLKAALAIREDLGRRVVSGTDGSCTWIALSYVPRFRGYRLMPLGVGLYDGAAGIALFLAALEKVTGCRAGVPSAHEALKPVRRFLERALERNLWQRENKGEMEAGLLIYPLILLGQLLNDESLIALARSSAALLTEEVFEQDHDFGILHGTAGILLGLLTLNRIEPSERTLATAISAGEYLLNNTLMKNEETGLVGSSLALRRLCAATGDERFAEAAAVAEKRKIGLADCAVGGLAELDALRSVSGSWTPNLENGVRSDSLYGGTFGIVDFYIEMALRTGADENLAKAREIAAAAIDRSEHCRKYRLFGELPEKAFLPGFFHGLSGIGYELMRLSAPRAVPSVLMSDLL